MSDWLGSAGAFSQVYWWIALPATGILAILLILSFIGGDADADAELDGDVGFQFLSLKNMVGFFTIFGWTGLVCIDNGMNNGWTIVISFIAGLAMMFLLASVYYFMAKATESGTLVMSNAIGKMGETYLTIPPRRTGYGKVQIRVQGSLRELEAVTDDEEAINTGSLVTVEDVINDETLLVKANR
jgi:succinate dehydrogenase hydrophobic anchor subunit